MGSKNGKPVLTDENAAALAQSSGLDVVQVGYREREKDIDREKERKTREIGRERERSPRTPGCCRERRHRDK